MRSVPTTKRSTTNAQVNPDCCSYLNHGVKYSGLAVNDLRLFADMLIAGQTFVAQPQQPFPTSERSHHA